MSDDRVVPLTNAASECRRCWKMNLFSHVVRLHVHLHVFPLFPPALPLGTKRLLCQRRLWFRSHRFLLEYLLPFDNKGNHGDSFYPQYLQVQDDSPEHLSSLADPLSPFVGLKRGLWTVKVSHESEPPFRSTCLPMSDTAPVQPVRRGGKSGANSSEF